MLAIGIAVFLGIFLTRGTTQSATAGQHVSTVSTPPAATTPAKVQKHVAPAKSALQVARTFLLTAVLRKNLDTAYGIVGPALKGGISRAQWRTGNIPVTYYPAGNAKTAQLVVKSSTKNQLLLEVGLKGRPGTHVKSLGFTLGVDRIGGKWLVNYFISDYRIPVRSNPYSN